MYPNGAGTDAEIEDRAFALDEFASGFRSDGISQGERRPRFSHAGCAEPKGTVRRNFGKKQGRCARQGMPEEGDEKSDKSCVHLP
jgi:hypothetical protein